MCKRLRFTSMQSKVIVFITAGVIILIGSVILIAFNLVASFTIMNIVAEGSLSAFRALSLIVGFGILGFGLCGVCAAWMDDGKCKTIFAGVVIIKRI